MLNASCHFYVSERGCSIKCSVGNFPSRVGRDTNSFGVALFAVILELPDGMPIYHAGTDNNLELRSVQELSAECFWQGSLRWEVEAIKCFVRASAVIPVERRQPGAGSLVLACSADPRGDGSSLQGKLSKVNTPLEEVLPKLGFAVEHICNPF